MNQRVVFDCMVFLQAASRPWRLHGLFEAARNGRLTLYVSPDVLAEVQDVLMRPEIQRRFPALTPVVVRAFLADVLSFAVLDRDVPKAFSFPRDPKDEKYLNLAIAAGAQYVASADGDLLSLMDETTADGQAFRTRFPEIEIIKPGALMTLLETEISE
jgi:putative PIN family toxin of toxin-antitoxin system